MTIKKTLLIVVACAMMLCACSTKTQPEPQVSPTVTPTEALPKSSLDILRETVEKENALCGVAFLGYFEGEYEEVMAEWVNNGITKEYPFLTDITEEQIILTGGGEWFLLVPADKYTTVKVYESFIDYEDFLLKPGVELYNAITGAPILIRGNVSDIYPSTVIIMEKETKKIEYSPYISLKDGSLAEGEGVYVIGQ